MDQETITQFVSLGLSEQKAKETLKNQNLTNTLKLTIDEAKKLNPGDFDKNLGKLLYQTATTIKSQVKHHLPLIVSYVASGKIDSELKLKAAIEYLLSKPLNDINVTDFETAAGVGFTITPEEIEKAVEEVFAKHNTELLAKRYQFNVSTLLHDARTKLKFADGKAVKNEVDLQLLLLLGPKTEGDKKAGDKKSGDKKNVAKTVNVNKEGSSDVASDGAQTISELVKNKIHFHKVGENFKTDGYVVTPNTEKLLLEHVKNCGGKVHTRFPPEPNGILHIGHAKAININFGYAQAYGGNCYLRYDDTNPEKEEEKFVRGIKDMVEWLGYQPFKVTYSSNYFDELFDLACKLIEKGHAYVCHQKQEEIKGFNPPPSPWRDRPVEENMKLFLDMKNGLIEEGGATLRMKVTLEEGKQDPVAYRIKFLTHHNTGDKWCIYPTYDYTHCLCDSLENITHSLCTKEFQSRRSSYYWLCNVLDIYCPVQWEYARLNVNYTVVSKRKIGRLITEKIVSDWDDPRLFTLTALRRRGFPAEAINNFCAQMGVTGAQSSVDPSMLEAAVRDVLNYTAPRVMAVLDPLKVKITLLFLLLLIFIQTTTAIEVPDFPSDPKSAIHKVSFEDTIFIERTDFRESLEEDKDYRRLTRNQPVGLRHVGYVITVTKVIQASGVVTELEVECQPVDQIKEKPKAFIHWVSAPLKCEVRLYDRLFKHRNPEDTNEVPGGFVTDCNIDSLTVLKNALIDVSVRNAKVYDKFQFERIGFFSIDTDSKPGNLVFNRTVSLKEAAGKQG